MAILFAHSFTYSLAQTLSTWSHRDSTRLLSGLGEQREQRGPWDSFLAPRIGITCLVATLKKCVLHAAP